MKMYEVYEYGDIKDVMLSEVNPTNWLVSIKHPTRIVETVIFDPGHLIMAYEYETSLFVEVDGGPDIKCALVLTSDEVTKLYEQYIDIEPIKHIKREEQ